MIRSAAERTVRVTSPGSSHHGAPLAAAGGGAKYPAEAIRPVRRGRPRPERARPGGAPRGLVGRRGQGGWKSAVPDPGSEGAWVRPLSPPPRCGLAGAGVGRLGPVGVGWSGGPRWRRFCYSDFLSHAELGAQFARRPSDPGPWRNPPPPLPEHDDQEGTVSTSRAPVYLLYPELKLQHIPMSFHGKFRSDQAPLVV